jgi:hypothetical protein
LLELIEQSYPDEDQCTELKAESIELACVSY